MGTKITPAARSLTEALKADLAVAKEGGVGLKAVASKMGRSYSWAAEMVRGEQTFPLSKLGVWVRLTGGLNLARWVAHQAGCDLVPQSEDDLETTLVRAVKESADVTQTASAAMLDGEISEEELAAYEREMDEAIENFRRLQHALRAQKGRKRLGPSSLAEAERLGRKR